MASNSKKVKTGILTSTPIKSEGKTKFLGDSSSQTPASSPVVKPEKTRKHIKLNIDLIVEAVRAIGVNRKGASFKAITKYISAKSGAPDLSLNRVRLYLKKAILKGIETGRLIRPRRNLNSRGLNGSFKIPYKKPTKKSSEKYSKSDKKKKKSSKKATKKTKKATKKTKKAPISSESKSAKRKKDDKAKHSSVALRQMKANAMKVPKETAVKTEINKELNTKDSPPMLQVETVVEKDFNEVKEAAQKDSTKVKKTVEEECAEVMDAQELPTNPTEVPKQAKEKEVAVSKLLEDDTT